MGVGLPAVEGFHLLERAGGGAMGSIYRAKQLSSGRIVALKFLRHGIPDGEERFAREATILSGLAHDHVVRYVAHGRTAEDVAYVAMEWVEGEDLARRLKGKVLDVAATIELTRRLASALGHVHLAGVVHRDVKPANILLVGGDETTPMLVDFGLARSPGSKLFESAPGMLLGTPGYMAPEQIRGAAGVDARADVFALGCIAFRCLAGHGPFTAGEAVGTLTKILFDEPPRLAEVVAGVPDALDELVASMLAKPREDRPRDGNEIAERLLALDRTVRRRVGVGPSLTQRELRIVSVVVATPERLGDAEETLRPEDQSHFRNGDILRAVAVRFGAEVAFVGAAIVVTLAGSGSASDEAQAAARLALALRPLLPELPMALATGRTEVGRASSEIAERAVVSLRAAPVLRGVRVDEVTAGLLGAEFVVESADGALLLTKERSGADAVRTLLGQPTPCVGRDRDLAKLNASLEDCLRTRAPVSVLVTAPAGVGKSRLRYEWLSQVRARGLRVWTCRADPVSAGSPFGMLGQLVRRTVLGPGEEASLDARSRRTIFRARVARRLDANDSQRVAEFLGELAGVVFPDDDREDLKAARQDPMLMGDQMRRAWEEWIAAEASDGGLVLVFEDLHWGDTPTVRFVDHALVASAGSPLFVLALARPEARKLFPRFQPSLEMRLSELPATAATALARHVLGPGASEEIVAGIVARAAGNAFFLEELLRAAAEGRGDDVPETVLAMAERRLLALAPEDRRVLRAASVFGQTFWNDAVAKLLGGGSAGDAEADFRIRTLSTAEFITARSSSRFASEVEYVFRHALVRDASYAMLTEDDRRLGHRLAAEWLEGHAERDPLVLAEHHVRGGTAASAAPYFLRAAVQAMEGNDLDAVVDLVARGVAAGAEGMTLGELRRIEAEAERWRGRIVEAEVAGKEAVKHLPRLHALWYAALGELATVAGNQGHMELLHWIYDELREAPWDVERPARVSALSRVSAQLYVVGQREDADWLGDLAETTAAGLDLTGAPAVAARLEQARGFRALYSGDLASYLTFTRAALAGFRRLGDRRNACAQSASLGYGTLCVGAVEEAEEVLASAIPVAHALSLVRVVTMMKQNLGRVRRLQGRFADAAALHEEAVAVFAGQGDLRLECYGRCYLALAKDGMADAAAAVEEAKRAVSCGEPLRPAYAVALATLSLVLRNAGAPEAALEHAQAAQAVLEELGGLEDGESLVRLAYAEALDAAGHASSAKQAFGHAVAALETAARKLSDVGLRKSLFTRVPENARTLARARELGLPTPTT